MSVMCIIILAFISCFFTSTALELDYDDYVDTTRVVGGYPTTINDHPYIVQLLLDAWHDGRHVQICAGTILTIKHLLSAAHCFQIGANGNNFTDPKYWRVRVGSSFRSSGGTLMDLSKIVNHPYFDPFTYTNDVSVLVLSEYLQLSESVKQAVIAQNGAQINNNAECILIGWGATIPDGPQSEQLNSAKVYKIDPTVCADRFSTIGVKITETMLCAGLLDNGSADGCYGDSGGPLLHNGVVVGIVSFGHMCGHRFYPGVYTNIAHFTSCIVSTVNDN